MRVERSFAFVDVSGFTKMTELEGDEHAVEVLTAFRSLLRDICSRRGVRIAKWLGDGVMLVCVTTRPLLETILELHHKVGEAARPVTAVAIRSGVSSGEVILMEGDDYVGHSVNVAARLCDLADAGEALAAPSVIPFLPRWGRVVRQIPVMLRGVENPLPASSFEMDVSGSPEYVGPHLRPPAQRGDGRADRAGRGRRGRAPLLTELRRHLAPATGSGRHPLSDVAATQFALNGWALQVDEHGAVGGWSSSRRPHLANFRRRFFRAPRLRAVQGTLPASGSGHGTPAVGRKRHARDEAGGRAQ